MKSDQKEKKISKHPWMLKRFKCNILNMNIYKL